LCSNNFNQSYLGYSNLTPKKTLSVIDPTNLEVITANKGTFELMTKNLMTTNLLPGAAIPRLKAAPGGAAAHQAQRTT
jgi:hypothetical protein